MPVADPFLTADTIEDLSKYNYPSSQRVNDDMECWIGKNMEFVRLSMMNFTARRRKDVH